MTFRDQTDLCFTDTLETYGDHDQKLEIEADGDITVYSSTGFVRPGNGSNQSAQSNRPTHVGAGEMLEDLLVRVDMARCILLTARVPDELIDLLETRDIHDRLRQEDRRPG